MHMFARCTLVAMSVLAAYGSAPLAEQFSPQNRNRSTTRQPRTPEPPKPTAVSREPVRPSYDPVSGTWDVVVRSEQRAMPVTRFKASLKLNGEQVTGELDGELAAPDAMKPDDMIKMLKIGDEVLRTPVSAAQLVEGRWANCILTFAVNVGNANHKLALATSGGELFGDYQVIVGENRGSANVIATRSDAVQAPGECDNKYIRPTVDRAAVDEAAIVATIVKDGPGDRFVIPGIAPRGGTGKITLRWVSTLASLLLKPRVFSMDLEFPGDDLPIQTRGPSLPMASGSIHRFNGLVQLNDPPLDKYIFQGAGDKANRLTFALIEGIGYVYVRGKGTVVNVETSESKNFGYFEY